jgi:hypothetical protein
VKSKLLAIASSLLFIVVVAFAARVAFAWVQEREMPREALEIVPLAQETGNIAYSLVTGKGYSSPFRSNTGPTAWLPPVYPVLIAGIFLICGPLSMASLNASILLNIACSAGTCIPIFFIGKRVGGVPLAATAAWLWALFPNAIMLPYEWIWDTSMSALLAAFLLWAALLVADTTEHRDWCAYGVFWGFSLLTNPALGSLLPPFLAWAGYRAAVRDEAAPHASTEPTVQMSSQKTSRLSRSWQRPALAAAIAILCCVPWTIRNYVQFHKFIPVRSNFAFELWTGNNNIFDPHTGTAMSRISKYGEVRQFTQLGEIAFMEDKWRKATLFMRTHPQLVVKLELARVVTTWMGTQHFIADFMHTDFWLDRLVFVVNTIVLVGTVAGIILLYRRRNPYAFPLAAAPILFPIIYYITHTSLRYRHPLDPVLMLLTGVALTAPFRGKPPAAQSQFS